MVFSIFTKKSASKKPPERDEAAAEHGSRPQADRSSPPKTAGQGHRSGSPVTSRPPQSRESVEAMKEAARQTAAKIDRIESEMISAASPTANMPKPLPPSNVPSTNAKPLLASSLDEGGVPSTTPHDSLSRSTSIVLGDSADANAIDVMGSQLPGILEEAAILYSNGQNQPAKLTLESAIQDPLPPGYASLAWLMLFDYHQLTFDRAGFDGLAMDYAARFEASPPAWKTDIVDQPAANNNNSAASFVAPAHLDDKLKSSLQTLLKAAANKREVRIDFGNVRALDLEAAGHLVAFFKFFTAAERPLVVQHAQRLQSVAAQGVEGGRRDDNDAMWQLSLMCLRLLGQHQQFDDLSIDFCVTYEVSPPSWEPMPAWVRGDAENTLINNGVAASDASGNSFVLKGDLVGAVAQERQSLKEFAQNRRELTIDCRKLKRLDFSAAGEILNEVVNLRNANKSVLFVEPNYLVYTLMMVMGLHEVAEIRTRKS